MRTIVCLAGVVLSLASGCGRPSAPEAKQQTANVTFVGYNFIFDYPPGTPIKTEGSRSSDGKGNDKEDITAACGDQVLRIVNGKMTLNGSDRGTVKEKDVIKLSSTGKVWVNDKPRSK